MTDDTVRIERQGVRSFEDADEVHHEPARFSSTLILVRLIHAGDGLQ
jgi:hypothetical protein